jgi:hypothetical protein
MTKLLRSKDRKVTNAVSPNGKTATIANTSVYLLEKISRALVPLVYVKAYAMQENSKTSSLE